MTAWTAAQLLAVPLDQPERLFENGLDAAKSAYHALLQSWHPDRGGDAAVAAHLNRLYEAAVEKIKAGTWSKPGEMTIATVAGGAIRLRYLRRHAFELGEIVYARHMVAFLVTNEYADLCHSAKRTIDGLGYRDGAMKAEMARFLPSIKGCFETTDGRCVLVLGKTPDVFLLRDVLGACAGALDPRHVGWIMSAVYNLACYLDWAKLTHNAITADTVWISPQHHSALLLGGWWYAAPHGARLTALPTAVKAITPPDILHTKRADHRLDLALVRALGRELLGDRTGMRLAAMAPKAMADFLRQPTSAVAVRDYRTWKEAVLLPSFGAPRFVRLDVTESAIYDKETDHGQ